MRLKFCNLDMDNPLWGVGALVTYAVRQTKLGTLNTAPGRVVCSA